MTTLRQSGRAAFVLLGLAFGMNCSVNRAGLSADAAGDAPALDVLAASVDAPLVSGGGGTIPPVVVDGGAGGSRGTGGDNGTSATGGDGSGGTATGGATATGGTVGTGGLGASAGTGGTPGSGGFVGSGGIVGTATGGSPGTGGGASGGRSATGGDAATGGSAGGTGGRGTGGVLGSGGNSGRPGCDRYPNAQAFVPPGDDRTHCYWCREEKLSWSSARAACQTDGGDLATILSKEENDFIRGMARFGSNAELWIGATDGRPGADRSGPGAYQWITNERWGYTSWNRGPPQQPDGYCDPVNNGQPSTCDHRATLAPDGTWSDFWQDNPRGFLCEITP